MNILGIETATRILGIGLVNEAGLVAEYRLNRGYKHAELLADATKRLLTDAGLGFNDLDGLAVSIGPGSFTGLRVGLSYIKGLALATGLPVAAVPTMQAMVSALPPVCETACVLITARKGEVYRGLFHWRDAWINADGYEPIRIENVTESLPDQPVLFLGEGVGTCHAQLDVWPQARFADPSLDHPNGCHVAKFGRKLLAAGETADIQTLDPHYLKPFQGVH